MNDSEKNNADADGFPVGPEPGAPTQEFRINKYRESLRATKSPRGVAILKSRSPLRDTSGRKKDIQK